MTDGALAESILDYIRTDASLVALVLDETGRILRANRYAEQLVGEELSQRMLAEIIVDFTHSLKFPDILRETDRVHLFNIKTANGLPQTLHFRFRKAGSNFLCMGEINSIEMETLREGLVAAGNELSNLGRELQKKNAELVKLNELKNEFLGMAAHDLRSPISSIYSFSAFLLEEAGANLDQDHVEFLSAIHFSSKFMLGLLSDLLDIAKIESGKLNLNKIPTDIIRFIDHNINLNRMMAKKKEINIVFTHYETIPDVSIDRQKIGQVLNNLISNAIKFSPQNTTVTVDVFISGENIIISIKDEGPGIPEEEQSNLFKPFSRTSVRATEGEKSTGLGLFIVQKIVLGHMGRIWLDGKVGKGSNFCFSLPIPSSGEGCTAGSAL